MLKIHNFAKKPPKEPKSGEHTLARLIARITAQEFAELSAVNASVKDVRELVASAQVRLGERDVGTILFLDEVHRFNKAQQDALLPSVESGLLVLIVPPQRTRLLK